ncbi:hypothetical protein K440DRAFT_630087, partial [Wilcoxina mikolae CBS 423.85]
MHSLALTVALLSLFILSATAQQCTVNLPILTSLPYQFTLNVQNSSWTFNKSPVQYIPLFQADGYRSVVAPSGSAINVTFTNGQFILSSSPSYTAVSVFVPPAEVFRYVRFQPGGEALSIEAHYGCDENGKEQVEFVPVSAGTQLGFCVAQDRAGTYDLSLKPRAENNNPCVDVVLATWRQ